MGRTRWLPCGLAAHCVKADEGKTSCRHAGVTSEDALASREGWSVAEAGSGRVLPLPHGAGKPLHAFAIPRADLSLLAARTTPPLVSGRSPIGNNSGRSSTGFCSYGSVREVFSDGHPYREPTFGSSLRSDCSAYSSELGNRRGNTPDVRPILVLWIPNMTNECFSCSKAGCVLQGCQVYLQERFYASEDNIWRWTSKRFLLQVILPLEQHVTAFSLELFVPAAIVQPRR